MQHHIKNTYMQSNTSDLGEKNMDQTVLNHLPSFGIPLENKMNNQNILLKQVFPREERMHMQTIKIVNTVHSTQNSLQKKQIPPYSSPLRSINKQIPTFSPYCNAMKKQLVINPVNPLIQFDKLDEIKYNGKNDNSAEDISGEIVIEQMIHNPDLTFVQAITGNEVRMEIILRNGTRKLIVFETFEEDCTVQDLLIQANLVSSDQPRVALVKYPNQNIAYYKVDTRIRTRSAIHAIKNTENVIKIHSPTTVLQRQCSESKVKIYVRYKNGKGRLIIVEVPKEGCSIQDILEQENLLSSQDIQISLVSNSINISGYYIVDL